MDQPGIPDRTAIHEVRFGIELLVVHRIGQSLPSSPECVSQPSSPAKLSLPLPPEIRSCLTLPNCSMLIRLLVGTNGRGRGWREKPRGWGRNRNPHPAGRRPRESTLQRPVCFVLPRLERFWTSAGCRHSIAGSQNLSFCRGYWYIVAKCHPFAFIVPRYPAA